MLGKLLIAVAILSGMALFVTINTTVPASAGASGVLAVFVLTYLFLLSLCSFMIYGISQGVSFFVKSFSGGQSQHTMSLHRAYYFSTIIALAPVIVMSMQSVGDVGIYELGLIGLLIGLGCLYVAKRTAQ